MDLIVIWAQRNHWGEGREGGSQNKNFTIIFLTGSVSIPGMAGDALGHVAQLVLCCHLRCCVSLLLNTHLLAGAES